MSVVLNFFVFVFNDSASPTESASQRYRLEAGAPKDYNNNNNNKNACYYHYGSVMRQIFKALLRVRVPPPPRLLLFRLPPFRFFGSRLIRHFD